MLFSILIQQFLAFYYSIPVLNSLLIIVNYCIIIPTCIESVKGSLLANFQGGKYNYSKLLSWCYSLPGKHHLTNKAIINIMMQEPPSTFSNSLQLQNNHPQKQITSWLETPTISLCCLLTCVWGEKRVCLFHHQHMWHFTQLQSVLRTDDVLMICSHSSTVFTVWINVAASVSQR